MATILSTVKSNLSLSPLSSLIAHVSALLMLDLGGRSPLGPYSYCPLVPPYPVGLVWYTPTLWQ